jgi:hypothetical protein
MYPGYLPQRKSTRHIPLPAPRISKKGNPLCGSCNKPLTQQQFDAIVARWFDEPMHDIDTESFPPLQETPAFPNR